MKMLKSLEIIGLSAIAVLCGLQAHAAQTNLVQNITLTINAVSQGSSTTNGTIVTKTVVRQRLSTLDVIAALGSSTGNSFSSTAKLLQVTPLPDGDAMIVVKDGTNVVDVTGFFSNQRRSQTMESSVVDQATGKGTATDLDIQRFQLQDNEPLPNLSLHFDARGLTTTKSKSLLDSQGTVIGEAHQVLASLSGDGDHNGTNAVMQVLLKITGTTVQIQ